MEGQELGELVGQEKGKLACHEKGKLVGLEMVVLEAGELQGLHGSGSRRGLVGSPPPQGPVDKVEIILM
jgi:hypothetical protein